MKLEQLLPAFIAMVIAFILALLTAMVAANTIESRSFQDVSRVLRLNGEDWVGVDVDGLQVMLTGTAKDEAKRFRALSIAGTAVDAARVIDQMQVTDPSAIQPPRFSIEILRNDEGISLIGLIPAAMDREAFLETVKSAGGGAEVTDLLDQAEYPAPDGWDMALRYGIESLGLLKRSKVSIAADSVELKAISDSTEEKRRLETALSRTAPRGIPVSIHITAPRPVITPYTLRFIIDDEGARFDACSTYTTKGREQILAAARAAGLKGKATCTIGLGIPSPTWNDAVVTGIEKLAELGGGSITFSDADVTFVASENTSQEQFDLIVGELKAQLPDAFSLHAILPEPVVIDGTGQGSGPPEFIATRSPEGDVRLRGRVRDDRSRTATDAFAEAHFGSGTVRDALRLDEDLPRGWSARVLASLAALAQLTNGSVVMQPDFVDIRGNTGNPDAKADIARILSEKLGESEDYRINVTYQKKLDPKADIPTPEECVQRINQILEVQQITFAPSSATIDDVARASIDNIATVMKKCQDVPMEVGGHTDSQGREVMNQALSQSRAEAVVNALLARRVLTSNLTAKGYGESQPIADNGTEEGRNANRRIEFKLIDPAQPLATSQTNGDAAAGTTNPATDKPTTAQTPSPAHTQPAQTNQTEAPDEQN